MWWHSSICWPLALLQSCPSSGAFQRCLSSIGHRLKLWDRESSAFPKIRHDSITCGGFDKWGYPIAGWFLMENPSVRNGWVSCGYPYDETETTMYHISSGILQLFVRHFSCLTGAWNRLASSSDMTFPSIVLGVNTSVISIQDPRIWSGGPNRYPSFPKYP